MNLENFQNNPSLSNTASNTTSDKRYFPRWQIKNRIVFHLDGQAQLHEARSRDLSCAGMALVSQFPLTKEQKI